MTTGPKDEGDRSKNKAPTSTPELDRLEKLANAAATSAQAKQWRARKNGLREQDEPSEVRNLNHDAEAKAQAEAAMQRIMAAPKGNGARRRPR